MALIKCQECGNSISDQADSCPHCGLPYRRTGNLVVDDHHVYFVAGNSVCKIIKDRVDEQHRIGGSLYWYETVEEEYKENDQADSCPHCGLPYRRTGNLIVDKDSVYFAIGNTVGRIRQQEEKRLLQGPGWGFYEGTLEWKMTLGKEGWKRTHVEISDDEDEEDSSEEDE